MKIYYWIAFLVLLLCGCGKREEIVLQKVASGLQLPVYITSPPVSLTGYLL